MAKLTKLAGVTSQTVQVFIQDSSVTTGAGLTGLVYNSAGLVASYVQPGASRAAITLATLAAANSAYSSGGFKEIDSTNCPGLYRLDIPDACLTGASHVTIHLKGATNMVPCLLEIDLVSYNPFDSVRLGLTALPNAAAEAAGGLYTRGTGAGQINQDANGRVDTNVKTWIGGTIPAVNTTGVPLVDTKYVTGTLQTARDLGASVLLSSGTGTGQLDFTSGVVKSNLSQILGTALTETAGQIAAAFKKWFNVATPTGTVNSIPDAVAGASGGLFIAGTNAATTVTTSFTTTFTGNLTGSVASVTGAVGSVTGAVGSVTGAVGSVTGNVGGNVVGSVGSVVGAVGSVTGAVGSVTGAVGSVTGNVGGNVVGTVGGLTVAGLATLFTVDSTKTYADAVAGSPVKEIASNSGGGGGTTQREIHGFVTGLGTDCRIQFYLLVDGILATGASLSSPSIVGVYGISGIDLGFVANAGPTVDATSGMVYATGTLTTPPTTNAPIFCKVAVTHGGSARSGAFQGVVLSAT